MKLRRLVRLEWDRTTAVITLVLGVAAVILGWVGASSTLDPGIQIPYALSGGVGGILLVVVGATLWLSADLRDEWCKLDAIDDTLKQLRQDPTVARPAVEAAASTNGTSAAAAPSSGTR